MDRRRSLRNISILDSSLTSAYPSVDFVCFFGNKVINEETEWKMEAQNLRKVFLDSNSAMPVREVIVDEMRDYHLKYYGNPQSIHGMGSMPKKALNRARDEVASLIGSDPSNIVFTSGATESINLSLKGVMSRIEGKGKLVVSAVDHQSVISTARAIHKFGHDLEILPVDDRGKIDLSKAKSIIQDADLVSVPTASFEVGTLQDVDRILEIAHEEEALIHVDLVPSAFQLPFDIRKTPVDMATISGNSLLGPKGTGALYIADGVEIEKQIDGGGQEWGIRSGSSNIPGIVGMGSAAKIAKKNMEKEAEHMTELRGLLIESLLGIDYSYLNGDPVNRLPNNVNLGFDYVEGESMLMMLDMNDISASSGSACTSETLEPSPTLTAMGLPPEKAHGSLQFVLNPYINENDIQRVIDVMPGIVDSLRHLSPLWNG